MPEPVKSAERALRIIELLTDLGELDFPDVCAELGIPKSSAHSLLSTMRAMGFVRLDERSRRYTLGPRVWEAGQAYLRDLDIPQLAMPYMQRARDELRETVQLAVLDGIENVYVGKIESDHPLQLVSRLGSRLPAYATGLGKALLAGLSDAEVIRRLNGVDMRSYTSHTITNHAALLDALADVRRRGYATDRGEYTEGVYCVAAPINDRTETVAAISVSIPDVRVNDTTRRRMIQVITTEAAHISHALGAASPLLDTVDTAPA